MKKLTKTIACAAATAATTAFWATTVAIETATAASFTYTTKSYDNEIKIDYGDSQNFADTTVDDWSGVWVNGSALALNFGFVNDYEGYMWTNEWGDLILYKGEEGEIEWRNDIHGEFDVIRVEQQRNADGPPNSGGVGGDGDGGGVVSTPEPSGAIALGVLGLGAVASRLRRRSK